MIKKIDLPYKLNAFWNIINWDEVNKRWDEICPIYRV